MVHAYFFCSLRLLSTCEHMDSTHAIGNQIVDHKKSKTLTYSLKDGKWGKRYDLVIENIPVHEFMNFFVKRLFMSMQGIHIELDGWICNSSCARICFHWIPLFWL